MGLHQTPKLPLGNKGDTRMLGENIRNVSDEGLIPRVDNELQKFNSEPSKNPVIDGQTVCRDTSQKKIQICPTDV